VSEDFRAYGVGNSHRHVPEMKVGLARLNGGAPQFVFTPHLLPVRRGILETMYVPLQKAMTPAEAVQLFGEEYADEPFVEICAGELPTLRRVLHRNVVSIGFSAVQDITQAMLIVVVAFDNLVKGAAGQAIQNANLMFGFPEASGLPR
jgi:N-acetyl-gamma-glutamyl-phosphate reductase